MTRTRAADDFATIRARLEELRREREGAQATESDLHRDSPLHRAEVFAGRESARLGDYSRSLVLPEMCGAGPAVVEGCCDTDVCFPVSGKDADVA